MAEQVATQTATDIWTIIGLSSLIASVVTVILGLLRDVLIERYRFKQQSEAGCLQRQIQIFSHIYFTLTRMSKGAGGNALFEKEENTLKQINLLIEENIILLPSRVVNKWLDVMIMISEFKIDAEPKKKAEQAKLILEKISQILDALESVANQDLIPKYRSIVGKTVSELSRKSLEN